MTKFVVSSRLGLSKIDYKNLKYIVVSITDPYDNAAYIQKREGLKGVIRNEFYDIEWENYSGFQTITDEQAARIVWFVNKHYNNVDMIVIHCEAGISRSSGAAAALSLLIEGKDAFTGEKKYLPNGLVYSKIIEAWKNWKEAEDDMETFLLYNKNKIYNFIEDFPS